MFTFFITAVREDDWAATAANIETLFSRHCPRPNNFSISSRDDELSHLRRGLRTRHQHRDLRSHLLFIIYHADECCLLPITYLSLGD